MTHEWTFQKKVSAGFVVMVCLALVTAAVAVYALRAVVANKDRVISVNAQNLIGAAHLTTAVEQESAGFRGFLLTGDERLLETRRTAIQDFVRGPYRVFPVRRALSPDRFGGAARAELFRGASDDCQSAGDGRP